MWRRPRIHSRVVTTRAGDARSRMRVVGARIGWCDARATRVGERAGANARGGDATASSRPTRGVALMMATVALSACVGTSNGAFYIEDVPQGLDARESRPRESLSALTRGARGREVQACATKCLATCVRGGGGAPGLGPASVRRDPVVFKDGFRSREYCLTECTETCARALGRLRTTDASGTTDATTTTTR